MAPHHAQREVRNMRATRTFSSHDLGYTGWSVSRVRPLASAALAGQDTSNQSGERGYHDGCRMLARLLDG